MRVIDILFIQLYEATMAETMVHAHVMRHLDRSAFRVHVAYNAADDPNDPESALRLFRSIPDVQLLPVDVGVHPLDAGVAAGNAHPSQRRSQLAAGLRMIRSLAQLAVYVRRHHIRIIHSDARQRDVVLAYLLARLSGATFVVQLHSKWPAWARSVVQHAIRHADAVIGVSNWVAESTVAAGCAPAKVHAVINGFDAATWDSEVEAGPVRAEFGVPPQVPLLATVSRLIKWKGHLDLVRALALVRDHGLDFRLLIVGADDASGLSDEPPFSATVTRLVGELGLEERVSFAGWRRDINRVMAAADVYAMPAFEEPCGLVYLEAMAASRPVVALRSGGVPEVVVDGETGLLAEPGDVAGLAANIERLLREPELRRRMGDAGRRRVETVLDVRTMTHRIEAVYNTVTRPASSVAPGSVPQRTGQH